MSLEINNQKSESLKWDTRVLKDVVDVYIGKTPPRKEHKWFSETEGVKWVSIKDLGNCGIYVKDTSEYLTHNAVSKFNVRVAPKNTVLLSFKLTVGRVAITTENMVTNEAIAHFIIKNEKKLSRLYLYYYLKTFNYNTLGSTSSIAKAINSKMVREIPITLPPIEIQDKISKILFNIDVINDINNNLELLLKTLYNNWFEKFAMYDKEKGFKEDKEFGEIPKEWSVKSLEDYVDFITGVEPGSKNYYENKLPNTIPFIRVGDLNSRDNLVYIDKKLSKNKILEFEDIVLSLDATIGIVKMGLIGSYSTGMRKLVIRNKYINKAFLYCLVKSERIQRTIEIFSTGTTILHAGKSIKHMKFLLPDKETMKKFNEIGQIILLKILENQKEIIKLTKLRDILLPKLMSGEIDISKVNL